MEKMETREQMRTENSFTELMKENKVVIPIIQRDYAQGRNDHSKAETVRKRLIDDWISVLSDNSQRMDFNYIYGNEENDIFYPVDGQQRLTSLYLLYWYLAHKVGKEEEIQDWSFDYRTRNSASEFFTLLKDPAQSQALFDILDDKKVYEKVKCIEDCRWFKSKWENDPTIMSCINFLNLLADKLLAYEDHIKDFWKRLYEDEKPAVYFTGIIEKDGESAETEAAKSYTRMNARGKRLTDFENIKAMLDDIEKMNIDNLFYCSGSDEIEKQSNTISWTYDSRYINSFYSALRGEDLAITTKKINEESQNWYELIYYVYSLLYRKKEDVEKLYSLNCFNDREYQENMYCISQKRQSEKHIEIYLGMIKSVFELLCYDDKKLQYRIDDFLDYNGDIKLNAIAFVIYIYKIWESSNQKLAGDILDSSWKHFEEVLDDLNFEEWYCRDVANSRNIKVAEIINKMTDGICAIASKDVDEYFVSHNFATDKMLAEDSSILSDIKCRIIERKIKSKLINDRAIKEHTLDNCAIGKRRYGYLYYACGFFDDDTCWSFGDWSGRSSWIKSRITEYAEYISANGSLQTCMQSQGAKLVYAYASQYDVNNSSLKSSDDINGCSIEHIWSFQNMQWMDSEYMNICADKKTSLKNLTVMLKLLLDFSHNTQRQDHSKLMKTYSDNIVAYFKSAAGYEDCWLRFAAIYREDGEELLNSELYNENNVVYLKERGVPACLYVYLKDAGKKYEAFNNFKDFNNCFVYFQSNQESMEYAHRNKTCTFEPTGDNSENYKHSSKGDQVGWDLSGNVNTRNMDILYRVIFNMSDVGKKFDNNFFSLNIVNGVYKLMIYEMGCKSNGKLEINISSADVDANDVAVAESDLIHAENEIDKLVDSPKISGGNYDRWIELWNAKKQSEFDAVEEAVGMQVDGVFKSKGGIRPEKTITKTIQINRLNWNLGKDIV